MTTLTMPFDSADALIRPSMTTRVQYSLGHPPPQQTEPLHCPYCDSDNTKRSRPSCSSSSGSPSSASLTQESFVEALEKRDSGVLPAYLSGLSVISLENDASKFITADSDERSVNLRFEEVGWVAEQSLGPGIVLNSGGLLKLYMGLLAQIFCKHAIVSQKSGQQPGNLSNQTTFSISHFLLFLVAPDMRGYGDTDAPLNPTSYSILHLVDDLVGLLDHFGGQQASVVGHDHGALGKEKGDHQSSYRKRND
ncbi:hypothetical protein FF1_010072 [Malus domestica]